MLISANIWKALIDVGVMLLPLDAVHVELRHEDRRAAVRLHAFSRPLNPSDITSLVGRYPQPGLLVVPSATQEAREVVEQAGWSWVAEEAGHVVGLLQIEGERMRVEAGAPATVARVVELKPGPVPWGTLTVARRLLERPSATQRELAEWAGVSQPRVSQILASLAAQRLVQRAANGWQVRDFDQMLRWWLDAYRGPEGISSFWYGLESPREQAQAVVRLLQERAIGDRDAEVGATPAVLSGDVAADFIAPWRAPARAVVYARRGVDLTGVGLIPAGEEEATLELIVPRDPGVWPTTLREADEVLPRDMSPPLADPLQILWDVRRSPGADTDEAVAVLWQELRARHRAFGKRDAA
ncbi:MAG TPA: helix-turn-helix domain-containing protein [Micromonosporaceae bacterium]|nr:helix-turn-helix domain-containing protein [Micromonosporaceae bacterium]